MSLSEVPDLSWLLASWRVVAGLSPEEVAFRLGVSPSTVRSWERRQHEEGKVGRHRPVRSERELSESNLTQLDQIYGAGGALADISFALATPFVLPPSRSWWHNFPSSGGPIWAWIRSDESRHIAVQLSCGPIRMKLTRACTELGAIVSAPLSIENPPVKVEFISGRGWVDFGVGNVPSGLGIPVVGAIHRMRPAEISRPLRAGLARRSKELNELLATHPILRSALAWMIAHESSDAVSDLGFTDVTGARPTIDDGDRSHVSARKYAELRSARRLSRRVATEKIRKLRIGTDTAGGDQYPRFAEHHLKLVESGGTPRSVPLFRSLLDTIYGVDGKTCREELSNTAIVMQDDTRAAPRSRDGTRWLDNRAEIVFPEFWVGPIWLRFSNSSGARETSDVELRWPPWRRTLKVRPGITVWTRRWIQSAPPLEVFLERGWHIAAGIGRYEADDSDRPAAVDINDNWVALGADGSHAIFQQMIPFYGRLLEHAQVRVQRLMQGLPRLEQAMQARIPLRWRPRRPQER